MDKIDLKLLRDILDRAEVLEISLTDASKTLQRSIDKVDDIKHFKSKFKYFWVFSTGFLLGLMSIYIYYLFMV